MLTGISISKQNELADSIATQSFTQIYIHLNVSSVLSITQNK